MTQDEIRRYLLPGDADPTRIPDSPGPHVQVDVEQLADEVARAFHETYERLAPDREASAVPWEDVPDANANLMRAVARDLLERSVIAA